LLIHSESYLEHVNLVINKSQNLSIAVAFWGDGSENLFSQWSGEKARIVCNLMTGGSNPKAIRALLDNPKIDLRHKADLHAKVLTGEAGTIIGSANCSTNGLSLEGSDIKGWDEAGFFSTDDTLKSDTSSWFDNIWDKATEVSEEELRTAEENWKKRRNKRPQTNLNEPIVNQPKNEFKDRDIYVAYYEGISSKEADKALTAVKKSLMSNTEINIDNATLDYFEDWPDEKLGNDLPKDSHIICVKKGPLGGHYIEGVVKRIPNLDTSFLNKNNKESTLQILSIEKNIDSWKLPHKDHNKFISRIKPKLSEIDLNGTARCIPLYKLMD
jgi:hypothetical protein